nr:MAG TPA: hypothetical protein [Caudoviricetes sp.]
MGIVASIFSTCYPMPGCLSQSGRWHTPFPCKGTRLVCSF